jgi:hypothetical protein
MKNPLNPTYRERERAPDKFDLEHHADLQLMMPDFDERLRAHEEKHDPFNEFTKDSLTLTESLSMPVQVDEVRNVTIALTGVGATGKVGSIATLYVVNAEPGHFTISGPGKKAKMSPEEEQALSIELNRIKVELEAKHGKLSPGDVLEIRKTVEELEPVALFEGTSRALEWWPDKEMRKVALKRCGDEAYDLQPLIANGRDIVVAWRKFCTWAWIVKLAFQNLVVPIVQVLEKLPAWAWAAILWLKPW